CAFLDRPGGGFGDETGFGKCFRGGDFDSEPGTETVLIAPDAGHLRPGIARDHGRAPVRCGQRILNGVARARLAAEKSNPSPREAQRGANLSPLPVLTWWREVGALPRPPPLAAAVVRGSDFSYIS